MGHPKRSLFATLNVQYSWSSEIMVMEEEEETPYLTGVDNSMYTCIRRTGAFDTKNMNSSRGKNLTQKLIIDNWRVKLSFY